MFGSHFYHERIRKSVAMFGTLFNNLYVIRKDSAGKTLNQQKVPLSYSPKDKFLERLKQNPDVINDTQIAVKLPRMSFEIVSMGYDPTRQLSKVNSTSQGVEGSSRRTQLFTGVPYNVQFQLNVYARSQDDALQVVEQILPFFTPQYTLSVKPLASYSDVKEDVPVTLSGITFLDDYEGALEDRRTIIYTLDFDMKINFYQDTASRSIIRTAIGNIFDQNTGGQVERITTVTNPIDASPDSDYGYSDIIQEFNELYATSYDFSLVGEPAELTVNISDGSVSSITINDPGAGFADIPSITIDPPAPAIRATALATVEGDFVNSITITDSGLNYTTIPSVTISPPADPTPAEATTTFNSLTNQVDSDVTITEPGTLYINSPLITFSPPIKAPIAATAIANIVDSGKSVLIDITDNGRHYFNNNVKGILRFNARYDSATDIDQEVLVDMIINDNEVAAILPLDSDTLNLYPSGTPDFKQVNTIYSLEIPSAEQAAIYAYESDGAAVTNIINPGAWYTVPPTVFLVGYSKDSALATTSSLFSEPLTASISRGRLSAVSAPNTPFITSISAVTVSAPTGLPDDFKAEGFARVDSEQVQSIELTDLGEFYTYNPSITIGLPDAAITATATAVLDSTQKKISSINITEAGRGYTSTPIVTIGVPTPAIQAEAVATLNSNNQVSAIQITEPGTNYLTVPTATISNPLASEDEQFVVGETISYVPSLNPNAIITGSVVAWNDTTNTLVINNVSSNDARYYPFEIGRDIRGLTSNATLVINTITEGEKSF